MVALLDAVDAAQRNGADADARFPWDAHILKSRDHKAYVPFVISLEAVADSLKTGALYVRAVSRRAAAAIEQKSEVRAWLRGAQPTARVAEGISVPPGEMPVGGPAISSSRGITQAAAESSTLLELQRRRAERDKAEAERAERLLETRDPSLFPFEEYYFFDAKSWRAGALHFVARAIALPAGDYDLYVAVADRGHLKDRSPVVFERLITVPDFWNDELRLSSLMLTRDFHVLPAPLARKAQSEQPYTFGVADATPNLTQTFSTNDVLTIVYQICNYGSPDADVTADYRFFRVDGERRLFNATRPQTLNGEDLPVADPWETQGFAVQRVPLASFPAGRYELEVSVRDRATRATAKAVAAFTVKDRGN